MTSILEGVVKRGTGKNLRDLKVPIAGKTGTTNNNYDAWFIGFSSNLVIGVYIGFDNPQSLGRYETGSKAALPVFKNFIKKALFKEDFKQFNIPEGIYFAPIDYDTGKENDFNNPKSIVEVFKEKDINKLQNKNIDTVDNYDKLIKFRQFY
jgi:penicillin-binding protein 1A